jgi:hypothetical protein
MLAFKAGQGSVIWRIGSRASATENIVDVLAEFLVLS